MKHYCLRTGFLWLAILVSSGQVLAVDTGSAESPAAKTAARPSGPDVVTLNFVNADIEGVVKAVSEITGKNFVLDPRVKGTISIVSARPMSRALVYQVFLSSIRVQGFTAVEQRGMVLIVPESDAKLYADAPLDKAHAAGDVVRTQVFRLQHESATQLVPILRPLIAPNNSVTANQSSNTLVVTDYASNLQRIEKIIASIDQPADSDSIIIPLKYASALDVAQIISRLLADPGQAADPANRFTIAADARSNSLLARAGDPSRLRRVRELVAMLDTPTSASGNIHVIYLKNAQAVKLADVLRAIHSGESSGAQSAAPAAASPIGQAAPAVGQGGAMASGIIQADAATNSIIITAPDAIYNNLRAVVEKLDVRRAQVYIEALIAEVTSDKAAEFGFQWQNLTGLGKNGTRVFGGTNFGTTGNIIDTAVNPNNLTSAAVGNGLNVGVIKGTTTILGTTVQILNLGVLVHALQTDGNSNILSTPTLLTLDNEEAKIVVGQNVPFVTGSYTNTGTSSGTTSPFQTVERKDVGLMLKIKPQISEGGVVRLQISEEVSNVDDKTNPSGIITNKRSVDSTVLVDDGQIVVIGGLIQDSVTDGADKVPFLGDIPVIGALFKHNTRSRKKTNLMVFLRPTLLRSMESASSLTADRYDYVLGEQAKSKAEVTVLPDFGSPSLPPRPSSPPPGADKPASPSK